MRGAAYRGKDFAKGAVPTQAEPSSSLAMGMSKTPGYAKIPRTASSARATAYPAIPLMSLSISESR